MTPTTGTGYIEATYHSDNGGYDQVAYDPFTGKCMVAYQDSTDNSYPKVKTLEWAGGRIKVSGNGQLATTASQDNGITFDKSISRFILDLKNIYEDEWKKLNIINTSIQLPITFSLSTFNFNFFVGQ